MNVLKKVAISTGALILSSGIAQAADVYTPDGLKDTFDPVRDDIWTGMYVGIHGGWADGNWEGELQYLGGEAGYEDDVRKLKGEGWFAGAQIGYDRQFDRLVLGVETDVSYTDFNGIETYATDDIANVPDGGYAKKHDLSIDYFGTVRGRLGATVGQFMPYVTGGFAWAKTKGNLEVSYPLAPVCCGAVGEVSTASTDEAHLGWTVGAGLEANLGQGWSLKGEYLYVDLGKEDYNFRGSVYNGKPFNTDSFESNLQFDVFKVGLNYRF